MKKNNILFFILITVALLLRVIALNISPPELFGDEVDVGYHAYSLLKTGKDYSGQSLPIYIKSLIEERAPLLIYSTVPSVGVFGLNEYGVRLPPAIWGVVSIIFLYLVIRKLFPKENLAILAAFLLAFSPWHLQYSRASFEATPLLALLLIGVYFFLSGRIIFSAIFFSLTLYTYNTAFVFTPLLLMLLIIFNRSSKKNILIFIPTFALVSLPILVQLAYGNVSNRFNSLSVFNTSTYTNDINFERQKGKTNLESLFHNKPVSIISKISTNYLRSFSSEFLFVKGDNTFRHGLHTSQLLWLEIITLPLGIIIALKQQTRQILFWLGWLVIAPIPASLTIDGAFHATRLFLLLPPLAFFSSFGLKVILSQKKLILPLLVLLIVNLGFYFHNYYVHYPKESWRWWQTGYKESMLYLKDHQSEYSRIFINNTYEPSLVRFLFWFGYNPSLFQQQFISDLTQENITPGFNGFALEKFYFGTINSSLPGGLPELITSDDIYMVSQEREVGGDWDWRVSPPGGIQVLYTVTNPLNQPIFYLVTRG